MGKVDCEKKITIYFSKISSHLIIFLTLTYIVKSIYFYNKIKIHIHNFQGKNRGRPGVGRLEPIPLLFKQTENKYFFLMK